MSESEVTPKSKVEEKKSNRLTKAQINAFPLRQYEGHVHVIASESTLIDAAQELAAENLLGFDTETRAVFKKGQHYLPSLVQLAAEKEVYIFQLKHLKNLEPLYEIMEHSHIIKAGVSIDYDIKELALLKPFNPNGFTELQTMAEKLGIENMGLRGMAAALLGFRISKNAQTSNWALDRLTQIQVRYAATDAWVGRLLYEKLCALKSDVAPLKNVSQKLSKD